MWSDLMKAVLSGPIYFRIFSGILLLALVIWVIIYSRITQNPVTKEEKDKLSPKIDIKLYPSPAIAVTPYKYPLKKYNLAIQNLNKDSVPLVDFRMEFIFEKVISEIKLMPLLDSGGNISVTGLNMYKKNENGTISKYEEQPIETSITKNFSLVVQQAKINDRVVNTNIAIFTCERWPERAAFAGDIIVDLSNKPETLKKPDMIGKYEGIYFYEIKGRKFSETITGIIPK